MDTFVELTEAECRDLLETDVVGRVAFMATSGPRIVPINYIVRGDALLFRTTAYSELAKFAPGAEIAFEIDQLDSDRQRGWSVVVHGSCERIEDTTDPAESGPEPWAGGVRPLLLELKLREVSGRRVGGNHWPHPVVSGRARRY